jgi:hypothetical protein
MTKLRKRIIETNKLKYRKADIGIRSSLQFFKAKKKLIVLLVGLIYKFLIDHKLETYEMINIGSRQLKQQITNHSKTHC